MPSRITTCMLMWMLVPVVGQAEPAAGPAAARIAGDRLVLENGLLTASWTLDGGRPAELKFIQSETGRKLAVTDGQLWKLRFADGRTLSASELRVCSALRLLRLPAQSASAGNRPQPPGWAAEVTLAAADGTQFQWQAVLRDGAHYLRQELAITGGSSCGPGELMLLDCQAEEPHVVGQVDGSPIVAGPCFLAIEHPMSVSRVEGPRATVSVRLPELKAGGRCVRSSVLGVAPAVSMRRALLDYLERERPRPYQPFLHYNSWYDIAWADRKMDEAGCLAVIESLGRELIEARGARLDAVVFDDGWDDNRSLWAFHAGFPRGFSPLQAAASRYGTAIGVWLSPWGGYGNAKKERLEFGRQQGFEMNGRGFSLAGPQYYARFRDACLEMIRRYGVNYFKFDGIAQGSTTSGAGAECADDVEALLQLVRELRQARADLFVNITTGTWPSPFWLLWGDSIWRSGGDMGFHGPGSPRQQWITYRDMITYRGVVQRGPLFPINSLMTQGICQSRLSNAAKLGDDLGEMAQEIRSFFATGTQLQELYVSPPLLTPPMWDLLAEGARWSRARADVLRDAHWIGGDPGQAEVYGVAAWSPARGIVMLRNPSDQPAEYALDLAAALELPSSSGARYRLVSPWKTDPQPELELAAGCPHRLTLQPFQVVVWEAEPRP